MQRSAKTSICGRSSERGAGLSWALIWSSQRPLRLDIDFFRAADEQKKTPLKSEEALVHAGRINTDTVQIHRARARRCELHMLWMFRSWCYWFGWLPWQPASPLSHCCRKPEEAHIRYMDIHIQRFSLLAVCLHPHLSSSLRFLSFSLTLLPLFLLLFLLFYLLLLLLTFF